MEKALRLTYKVVLPRLLRSEMESRLGVASPAYNRSGVRDQAYYEALAAELGDWFFAEIGPIDRANKLDEAQARARRLERGHLEDAATELVDIVHAMLPPVRRVVEARSAGLSWKRIAADNPTRAFFSLRDDYAEALARLWDDHEELIRRLS